MGGTRGEVGRIVAMAVGLAVVLILAVAGEAHGGIYRVAQCGWGVGAELDPSYPATEGTAFTLNPSACAPPPGSGPAGMRFEGGVTPNGSLGLARARWIAPPGTSFTAAGLTWSGSPQPGNWQGLGVDVGGEFHLLASSFTGIGPTPIDLRIDGQAWAFEAFLQCLLGGPIAGCTRAVPSTMRLSGLTLTLEDRQAPQVQLAGPLPGPGWHRGTAALEVGATDIGAGIAVVGATIDGTPILGVGSTCAVQSIEGESRGTKMQPCPTSSTRSVEVATTKLADGAHTLRGCATDFAGDQGCAAELELDVDNSGPEVSFVAASEGEVAATIHDRHSGPAVGTISARRADAPAWIDLPTEFDREGDGTANLTASLPDLGAGTWFFRVVAADAAGNVGSAQLRVSGTAAEVRRQVSAAHGDGKPGGHPAPRRRPTKLTVHLVPGGGGGGTTVDYGTAVELRGRLTEARGDGVAGRPVVVRATATAIGRGPERRRVLTDDDGRFALRLPPGTSRRVSVSFHGGGGFAATRHHPLLLRVRAQVSLVAAPTELRTGEEVRLSGHVRLGPAKVGGRGKLIAIQYLERATGRWRPALVVRTDAKGHFETSYRFRYVTGVARIRLRATAPAEGGWPFARGASTPVTVEVRGG